MCNKLWRNFPLTTTQNCSIRVRKKVNLKKKKTKYLITDKRIQKKTESAINICCEGI